jgi:hypothetical protein
MPNRPSGRLRNGASWLGVRKMALLRVDAVIYIGARSCREEEDEVLPPNGRNKIPTLMGGGATSPKYDR